MRISCRVIWGLLLLVLPFAKCVASRPMADARLSSEDSDQADPSSNTMQACVQPAQQSGQEASTTSKQPIDVTSSADSSKVNTPAPVGQQKEKREVSIPDVVSSASNDGTPDSGQGSPDSSEIAFNPDKVFLQESNESNTEELPLPSPKFKSRVKRREPSSSAKQTQKGHAKQPVLVRPQMWETSKRRRYNEDDFDTQDRSSEVEFKNRIFKKSKAAKAKKNSKRSKAHATKEEQLQILRTVQLLNLLIKQQKTQAFEQDRPGAARINPTQLAVAYEKQLTKVRKQKSSQEDDSNEERREDGLSWAAALILAIPPSILAIMLAKHLAKRQSELGLADGRSKRRSIQAYFGGGVGDFDADSESSFTFDDDVLKAEGEAYSYDDYIPRRPSAIRIPRRLIKGMSTSRSLPKSWVESSQHQFYRPIYEPLTRRIGDGFDYPHMDSANGTSTGSGAPARPYNYEVMPARPYTYELADLDYLGEPAWVVAADAGGL